MSIPPSYSTPNRSIYGPVPANTQDSYASVEGSFHIKELLQTDVLDVIRQEPLAPPNLKTGYEVSLSKTLKSVYGSVGKICCEGGQLGSCTLISWNLGIIPCHCIEEFDVKTLTGTFGNFADNERQQTILGTTYKIECIVEYDQELDYAVVRFHGLPGKEYGFASFHPDAEANSEPALLHHPIGKPLKVSIRPIVHSKYYKYALQTYHDSDYGSSGGAYISPSRLFVAMHLGAERHQMDYNLVRLALPIRRIIEKNPNGLIALFAYQKLVQTDMNHHLKPVSFFLPFIPRNFIDLENYNHKMMKKYGYVVCSPSNQKPGIIIDSHQKKHLPSWPTQYGGGPGSKFPLSVNNDDLVTIGETIASDLQLFKTSPKKKQGLLVERWPIDKKLLGKPLYRKLTKPPKSYGKKVRSVNRIGIEYGWNKEQNSWEMHFYPIS